MAVPNIFGTATAAIPLSQLDTNFATAITLGNTAVYLGNTTTSLGNLTLTNVTISSGTSNITTNVATVTGTLPEANGGTGTTTGYYGFKNRIINGEMDIDQRNAGASVTANDGVYGVDRFKTVASQTSKLNVQQNAGNLTGTNLPSGYKYYLGYTSTSAYSITSTDYFQINQSIEGFNIADLNWGTANAQTVTLSFWVRSSLTGTFAGLLLNSAFTHSYPFTYTISSANTWEQKSITIAGPQVASWDSSNGIGVSIRWGLGLGSTFTGGTNNTWNSGTLWSSAGTSVVGTNGATFYITGVQLEKGSTATSFDYRPIGTELALCQRYTFVWDAAQGGSNFPKIGLGFFSTSSVFKGFTYFPVTMRSAPTSITSSGAINMFDGAANYTATSIAIDQSHPLTISYEVGCSGATAFRPALFQANGNNTAKLIVSAEL